MYILSIIPLIKIPFPSPQILDYFYSQEVDIGGIVQISLGSRNLLGIVIVCVPLEHRKLEVKRQAFGLKRIEETIARKAVIPRDYLKLILWASEYYYSPLGLVARTLLPQIFSRPTKKFLQELRLWTMDKGHGENTKGTTLMHWAADSKSKMEFYENAIVNSLDNKKAVLFLIPELYKIDYFISNIPILKNATIFHSNISPSIEYKIWQHAQNGKLSCIIGTRSALAVAPSNLGLIIIDEEESSFYKSFDQQPYLNTKEIAFKLADFKGAKVILGTNLPSVESFWKAKKGKYELKIPATRYEIRNTITVDMREEIKAGNYSIFGRKLQEELKAVIENNQQAILFINRKGFSSGLLCRDCGHLIKCQNCDVSMVFHVNELVCHHCGKKQSPPSVCPKCQSYKIKFIGTGTQRVEEELRRVGSGGSIARFDSDIAPVWEKQKEILNGFCAKKIHILIGTQLMLKEGLLPSVELSAAVTIDPLLSLPDFRMAEHVLRVINKLQRVSEKTILQTYMPEHLTDLGRETWLETELKNREELSFPPFSQVIKLTCSHHDFERAEQAAKLLKNKLETVIRNLKFEIRNLEILGPAPAFIPRIKNRYIWQIMIKSKIEDLKLRNKLLAVVPSDWKIDVDPVEML